MFKFIKRLFPTALIAIDINFDVIHIKYLVHIENTIIKQESRKFTKIQGKIPEQFFTFISPIVLRYSYCYIILFFNKQVQNTIIGDRIKLPQKKKEYVKSISIDDKYLIYCNKFDIKEAIEEFSGITIDLLISPFVLLHRKYHNQDKNKQQFIILAKKNLLTMSIMENGVAVLSSNIAITLKNDENDYDDEEESTEDIEDALDDVFDDDDMADFDSSSDDDIEDDFYDIDNEMGINLDDVDDDDTMQSEQNEQKQIATSDFDSLNINLNTIIKNTIEDFMQAYYSGEKYEFLSDIRIYNDNLIDTACIKYLKDELMMDIELIHIDITETLLDMARENI